MASLSNGDQVGTAAHKTITRNDHDPSKRGANFQPATQAVHADDHLSRTADVAPPLHTSTTFRYPADPKNLRPVDAAVDIAENHIYSRWTAPNTTRLEAQLSSLLKGRAITYGSGLAAYHAALVFLNPKRVAIGDGYHGCHGVLNIHSKLTGARALPLDCSPDELQKGDLVHLETPLNPTGEAYNIKHYADKAHSRGAFLLVDATFGPPGLQDPFEWGADIVMHSGTKYLGGHSDMLCGVLAVQSEEWFWGLFEERGHLGNVMGSFEGWLGIRSLRTLELRVQRQSENADRLVEWLSRHLQSTSNDKDSETVRSVVAEIKHASLQKGRNETGSWLGKQMPRGCGPVFAIYLKSEDIAKRLPSHLSLFHHATSLGGVESLIEWRKMSDPKTDPRLVRVSVGVESFEDLRDDLLHAFKSVV